MKIGIIGAGKVGTAIGHVLEQKGMTITAISDMSEAGIKVAKTYLGEDVLFTNDNIAVVESSDIIAITTQDRIIAEVVDEIAQRPERLDGKIFFHTCGALPATILSPLDSKGAHIGALHPLQTFPDIASAIKVLPETYIFIEGNEHSIEILNKIGVSLGMAVIRIEGKHKVLYHLAAVFLCNLLCALLYAGEEIIDKTGVGLPPFFPIIKSTLKNVEKNGALLSLTGPVIRGDVDTVISHLGALKDLDLHREVYKALSLVALEMTQARGELNQEVREKLRDILTED
ncbi:MAG: DUF2520 domain-containing protein [Smithellaceae bacterium]|nr:DUF2520 domain-containing protein [Smithellaceae bacterium]